MVDFRYDDFLHKNLKSIYSFAIGLLNPNFPPFYGWCNYFKQPNLILPVRILPHQDLLALQALYFHQVTMKLNVTLVLKDLIEKPTV